MLQWISRGRNDGWLKRGEIIFSFADSSTSFFCNCIQFRSFPLPRQRLWKIMIKCWMEYISTYHSPNVWLLIFFFIFEKEEILSWTRKILAWLHIVKNCCFSMQLRYFIICASKFIFTAWVCVNIIGFKSKPNYKRHCIIMDCGYVGISA